MYPNQPLYPHGQQNPQGYYPQPGNYPPAGPAYPQPPGYPPGAQYGYGYQGGYPGPAGPREPSNVTAIIAAVLSLLGGCAALLGVLGSASALAAISDLSSREADLLPGWFQGLLVFTLIAQLGLAAALFTGGGFLFARKSWARIVIVVACGVTILISIVALIASNTAAHQADASLTMAGPSILSILGLVFPVATLVLALLPSTQQWCAAAKPANPQFGY